MSARVISWLARPGTLRTLLADFHLAVRLLREPAVPPYLKAVPLAALAYVLSPLDFLPDFFPIVGQLDDLGIVILGLKLFLRLCPAEAAAFHREAIARRRPFSPMSQVGDARDVGDVIDAEFRRQ
jgi:uncharacterized membrane protein YkvA (DUF1232 family)